ncbi:MAG: hypothetical protein DWQ04_00350 [Chloroflexi bacterium]|nr:MAG: hypothetical protein DWQ04_00350 [Chloroflexota bacterium]
MQQLLTDKPPINRFLFWGQWVLLNTIVVAIIITLSLIIDYIPHTIIGWSVIGISISIIQQLYLQRHMCLEKWALFSVIGWVIGVLVGKIAVGWEAGSWDVDWALVGVLVGIAQYFSMRRYVYQAGWWILASSMSLVMAGSLGGATALLEDWLMFKGWVDINKSLTEIIGYILAASAGGAVYGAFTGGWLIWLMWYKSRPMGVGK